MTHCTACGAPLRPNRLTESEALDAAQIARNYAKRIRADLVVGDSEYANGLRLALEDAAVQRDRLADKLEAMA